MSNALDHFSCLDELIQIIYQNAERFVVMSSVNHEKWTIHLGISGSEGRWWHGAWTEADILKVLGSQCSDMVMESFAEKLAGEYTQGELYVGNWSSEYGAKINLTIGPTSKHPMKIPLVEMSTKEAAAHSTEIFLDIALQAQSRKCRLHPSSVDLSTLSLMPLMSETKTGLGTDPQASRVRPTAAINTADAETPNPTKKQSQEVLRKGASTPNGKPAVAPGTVSKTRKGASLANPNKKARKYKEIEFESDEE